MHPTYLARIVALALAHCSLVSSARAQLPREITSQCRPALEKLREAYAHATFSGTLAVSMPQAGKSRKQEFTMRASGQSRRLDLTTLAQQGMGLEVGAKQMQMATPQGSLNTLTGPKSDYFDDARETSYDETVSQIDAGCLLNYPYSLDSSGTILDTLTKGGVKITSVKKIESLGEALVQITYEETATHAGRTGTWKTRLVLSPADGWALRGFTRTMGTGSNQITQRAKLSYSGVQDGVPLVQTIESETLEGGRPIKREAVDVTEVKLGDPDDYYFTSFAF
jgi:hypothetical protein